MLEQLLIDNIWLALILWAAVYASDYALTLRGARLYHAYARESFVFEGSYEITPYFQEDIDALRRLSPRFLIALLLSSVLLVAVWALGRLAGTSRPFSFVTGSMLLLEATLHIRHIRNISLFRLAKNGQGIKGKIEYSRWLILRLSTVEMFVHGGLFLLLHFVNGSWFFLGGAAGCMVTGLQHLRLARKAPQPSPDTPPPPE